MDTRLEQRLMTLANKLGSVRRGWSLAAVWLIAAMFAWAMLALRGRGLQLAGETRWWWLLVSVAATLAAWMIIGRRINLGQLAQRVEAKFPNLQQRLLTATQIRPASGEGSYGYLQRSVISETLRHDITHSWHTVVTPLSVTGAWLANVFALVCLLTAGWQLWQSPGFESSAFATSSRSDVARFTLPTIQPGNTEIERGSSVIVTARFDNRVPDEVWLVSAAADVSIHQASDASKSTEASRIAMRPSLNDPIFAAYLYDVKEPLQYRVEFEDGISETYRISVFEFPVVVRADAEIVFPNYAQQDAETIVNTRRITVPERSKVTWKLHLNKPGIVAKFVAEDAETIVLQASAEDPNVVETTVTCTDSQVWNVELVDSDGRENRIETVLRVKVLPNQTATIQMLAGGDARVSPLEEFQIAAKVKDDFSVSAAGIGYQFAGNGLVEIETLSEKSGEATDRAAVANLPTTDSTSAESEAKPQPKKQREVKLTETIDFESLGAAPDQLLSYYVWAEDRRDDGEVRRVVSDMYFAEVRPFEEIFRQGQQPSAQQQQQQQQQEGNEQTEELLELQKQIIVASWNVMRDPKEGKLLGRSAPDLVMLAESQASAIDLLQEKAGESDVPGAEEIMEAAATAMQSAVERLTASSISLSKEDLSGALSFEQSAYQQLLRLQSREFEVVRSQRSQSQSRSQRSSARQQQIDQLELENQENRYEDERLAQDQQEEQQSELRQIISRLRELAARQEDLNEQLREIQAALQAAETEQQKEELQRQLERLREQQQQMLQDSDELQERMQEQRNEEMQQAQEQLQQARQSLQQSGEALQQGNTGQALSAGTRAEQELKQLQDEVRQHAANQFQQTMQEMKRQASEIEQRQNQIVDAMDRSDSQPSAGLRDSGSEINTSEQLRQQRAELKELLDDMQKTVADAEEAEPLLAQTLYDSYRRTQQEQMLERLDVTEKLVERNLGSRARELAGQSVEDLSTLREDIDAAAEAVLGSEVESLRLALKQLDSLNEQLDKEIADATGREPNSTGQPSDSLANNGERSQEGQTGGAESHSSDQPGSAGERSNTDQQNQEQSGAPSQSDQNTPGQEGSNQSKPSDQSQSGQSQPGDSKGGEPSEGEQPSNQESESQEQGRQQQGQQPAGDQPGSQGSQPGQSQPGQSQPGQPQQSQQQQRQQQSGQSPSGSSQANQSAGPGGGNRPSRPGLRDSQNGSDSANANPSTLQNMMQGGAESSNADPNRGTGWGNPITGDGFRDWSDRLRDVEELVTDPQLRWQATEIRQAARDIRSELKKHAADPKWAEVEDLIARPLQELKRKVADELVRRAASKMEIVPVDRDPVPMEFSRSVRQYFENLGSGN